MSLFFGLIALLVALTVHEFAHAAMADHLGDPTAKLEGRKTLNPLAHIDPIGTFLLPLFLIFSGSSIVFGWGKPVPFDDYNLKNPRRDAALISLAGPASNLILATLLSLLFRLLLIATDSSMIAGLIIPLIILNVGLGIFNLIPIHPLDGSKILLGLLSEESAWKMEALFRQFGFFLLIFLLFPVFGASPIMLVISPIINLILQILLPGSLL